jgi:hypothetical protein
MFLTRSWLEFQSSHSRQCVGFTKTASPVEARTHPLSVRRQGKTRECTSSFSCTLSCRLLSNGAVNIGCQSRIMALFYYCYRAQISKRPFRNSAKSAFPDSTVPEKRSGRPSYSWTLSGEFRNEL